MFDITGFKFSPVCCDMEAQAGSTQGRCFQIFDHRLFLPHPIPDTHPTKWNPAPLKNNTQGWLFNLSKMSSLAAYRFAFLWKTSCVYVGSEEEVRQELETRTRQDLWWDRETLIQHGGIDFKSNCVGFSLMISYVIYDFLHGSSRSFNSDIVITLQHLLANGFGLLLQMFQLGFRIPLYPCHQL